MPNFLNSFSTIQVSSDLERFLHLIRCSMYTPCLVFFLTLESKIIWAYGLALDGKDTLRIPFATSITFSSFYTIGPFYFGNSCILKSVEIMARSIGRFTIYASLSLLANTKKGHILLIYNLVGTPFWSISFLRWTLPNPQPQIVPPSFFHPLWLFTFK